jgi:hypothetical protein
VHALLTLYAAAQVVQNANVVRCQSTSTRRWSLVSASNVHRLRFHPVLVPLHLLPTSTRRWSLVSASNVHRLRFHPVLVLLHLLPTSKVHHLQSHPVLVLLHLLSSSNVHHLQSHPVIARLHPLRRKLYLYQLPQTTGSFKIPHRLRLV